MKKQNLILGLILGGCAAAVACTSSGDDTTTPAGGAGGATGGSAGTHAGGTSAGSAGKASGGTSNGGGSAGEDNAAGTGGISSNAGANAGGEGGATNGDAGAGGEAGAPVVVVPPAPLPLDPNTVVVTSAAPTTFNHLLVSAADYATKGEVASVKLNPVALEDSTAYPDAKGDVVAVGSGGLGFALQRTAGIVNLLNGSKIKTAFDIAQTGTGAIVDISHKAYVSMYNYNFISVLDLNAGTVASRIDLSQFNDLKDSDGSVDATVGMYDPAKKIAYFVLGRIDLGSFDASFHLPCSGTKALVIGIDATTDTIVDLNGAAAGKSISLYLANPGSAQLSSDGKTITVLSSGCFDGVQDKQGVELVHLDSGSTTVVYAPTDGSTPNDLILVGAQQALLQPSYGAPYETLDLGTGTIGGSLNNVPLSAVFDGTNLLGVKIDSAQAATVVRYDMATDTVTTVVESPWVGKYSYASTSALVQ